MISLDNFNKNYVAKPDLALTSARVSTAVELSLPKGTLLHYVTDTIADLGLRGSNQLIQNWPGDIRLSFVLDGMGNLGNPTKKAFTTAAAIMNFKRTQKRFIYQTDWQRVINNEMSLGVLDYSLLKVTYNHVSALWRQYHEWFNIAQSIVEKANLVGKTKTQLIPVTMPSGQWPSEAQFKHCETKWGSSELEYMTDASHFWLRAIWRMGLGYTDELNFKSPENVYFAFIESGLVTIVNAKDLIARGIKDESKLRRELHDMWEKVIAARTKTDTEALADVKTDKRSENTPVTQEKAKTQLVEGVPDTATKRIIELGMAGKLTAAEQRRLIAVAQRERDHKSPFGDGTQTIAEAGTITVEKKKVNDDLGTKTRKGLSPAHARKSTTTGFVKDYMANGLYEADMVNVLTAFGGTGTFLADIKKTEVIDAVNDMDIIEATYISVEGKKSPLKFEIPRIEKDGNFLADNTKYCLDAQWVDVPLRKTAPDIARISAYPGKVAVMRSPLAKNRYDRWLQKAIGAIALDAKDDRITNQQFGASKIPDVALPLEYTAVMTVMTKFKTRNGVVFFFDYENRATELGDAALKGETNKLVACGKRGNNPVYMSSNGTVFELSNGSMIDLGHFRDIVGGLGKPPRDIVETQVFKKRIPLALALTLHLGLSGLIKKMGAKYRSEPSNQRASAGSHEIAITFKDVRIYVDATDPVISMMFAGLADMDSLSSFSMSDIDRKDVVGSLLRTSGLDASGIVELEIINEAFLDPMTIDTLKDMKLPTNMIDLYLEAAKLVRNDQMQEETDRRLQRRRKMERVPGFVYVAIYNAIRRQRNKPNPSIHGLEVGPRDVWNAMTQDQTSQRVKDLNPIHTLKEQEVVSLSGAGGRSAVSLVKKSRAFSQTDVGVISESTPDSGKVGVRTYMSGNSKVKNLRGLYEEFDFKRDGSTSVLSTTSLIMPGMTHDDQHSLGRL